MRAGFASVHADEDVRCAMFAIEIRGENASGGVKSGVVQRRRARGAANPVGSKKLLGHVKKPVSPECGPGPVGPTSVWMTSAKLNTRKNCDFTVRPSSCRLHNWYQWKNRSNKSPNMLLQNSGVRRPKSLPRVCYRGTAQPL